MENFKKIHSELNHFEKVLESMEKKEIAKTPSLIAETRKKIEDCISRLYVEREKEKKLFSELEAKYGPGELDLNTLEYKTKS